MNENLSFPVSNIPTPTFIESRVARAYGISVEDMKLKTRKREIVQARQTAMYFEKIYTKFSLSRIGERLGGKDHATVLHASKTINNLIDTNREFRGFIRNLNESFKNNEELKLDIEDLSCRCAQL